MCGIFGYSGDNPSIDKIKILGLYNEERGGDACGLYLNGEIIHGNNANKKFHSLIENLDIPEAKNGHTILGHTRKASSGGTDELFTHPYEIRLTDDKRKLPALIGVHNGTLYNWKDLAKKYDIDITNMNDSKLLFTSLAKDDFNILSEYDGAAAVLACHPSKKNTIMVYKGASKESYSYANNVSHSAQSQWAIALYGEDFFHESEITNGKSDYKEERPLFFYRESESSVYFSSMVGALKAIGGNATSILPVPFNKVLEFNCGKLVNTTEINRDGKKYYLNAVTYQNNVITTNARQSNQYVTHSPKHTTNYTKLSANTDVRKTGDDFDKFTKFVNYYKGRYCVGNTPIKNGIYYIEPTSGEIILDREVAMTMQAEQFAFVSGAPLILVEDYDEAVKFQYENLTLSRYVLHPILFDTTGHNFVFAGLANINIAFEPLFGRTFRLDIKDGTLIAMSEPNIFTDFPEEYDCAECEDTGRIDGMMCSCQVSGIPYATTKPRIGTLAIVHTSKNAVKTNTLEGKFKPDEEFVEIFKQYQEGESMLAQDKEATWEDDDELDVFREITNLIINLN